MRESGGVGEEERWRVDACIDYRALNAVTWKDVFLMPCIDNMLDQLGGKKIFSTLDARSGYWKICMDPSSGEKTAFATHEGLFEF